MLKEVIDYINGRIETLNIIESRHGICEIITDGTRTFPAEYCNNTHAPVSEFTLFKGVCYHRIEGYSIEQDNENSSNGCSIYSKKEYDIKSVFCVKKDVYDNNAYAEELIVNNLEKVISVQNSETLCTSLDMDVVSINIDGVELDRKKLYKEEYNIENKIGYEYAYFALSIKIIIEGELDCQTLTTC